MIMISVSTKSQLEQVLKTLQIRLPSIEKARRFPARKRGNCIAGAQLNGSVGSAKVMAVQRRVKLRRIDC